MTTEEALKIADEVLHDKTGKPLTDIQRLILRDSLGNKSYEKMEGQGYEVQHIKNEGSKLWQLLTSALDEKVSKSSFRGALEKQFIGLSIPDKGSHTNSIEYKEKIPDFMREKIEELCVLFDAWSTHIQIHYLNFTKAMAGDLELNSMLKLEIQRGKENNLNFGRIKILIDLYFPHLRDNYNAVEAAKTNANNIMLTYQKNCRNGDFEGRSYVEPFLFYQKAFREEAKNFYEIISKDSKYILNPTKDI
jgi:hypothetical protein